jgi:hypothetical protein
VVGVNEVFLAGSVGVIGPQKETQIVCGLKTAGWFG